MAEPTPGFTADEGSPNQLPRGAATELNDGTNVVAPEPLALAPPAAEAQATSEGQDATVLEGAEDLAPAQPADYEPIFEPGSEGEDFVTGPTNRPGEAQYVGAGPRPTLSPQVRAQLPALQAAASEPGASIELQTLVKYLLRLA